MTLLMHTVARYYLLHVFIWYVIDIIDGKFLVITNTENSESVHYHGNGKIRNKPLSDYDFAPNRGPAII